MKNVTDFVLHGYETRRVEWNLFSNTEICKNLSQRCSYAKGVQHSALVIQFLFYKCRSLRTSTV